MRIVPVTLVIASAMMLAVPVGAANWSAMGSVEPDNKWESGTELGKYNYADKPGSADKRIYFQAFEMTFVENLNVGVPDTADTHNENPTLTSPAALLGVWRDCNGDGYIGLAESALLEYPSELLQDTTVCPPKTGGLTSNTAFKNQGYPSNYNGWVTELIPIGGSGDGADPGNPDADNSGKPDNQDDDLRDLRIIRDQDAMVWGDFGLPNTVLADEGGGGTCAITPFPRGTLQSTGGAVNHVTCGDTSTILGAWNDVLAGRDVAGVPVPGADPGNSLGLRYNDENNANQAGHPLNQATLGSASSQNSAASVHDCGAVLVSGHDTIVASGIEQTLRDAGVIGQDEDLGSGPHNTNVYMPAPAVGGDPTQWTVPGTYNETEEDLLRSQDDKNNCDPMDDDNEDFYGILGEGDFTGSDGRGQGKRASEWNLGFVDINRGDAPYSLVPTKGGGGAGMHPFLGIGRTLPHVAPQPTSTYSGWFSNENLVKAPALIRANITAQTVEGGAPWILTFYAYLGDATFAGAWATPGSSRTYGVDQCGSFTSGVHNGWNCDRATWYFNDDGTPMEEPTDSGAFARPGQTYHLRDIDCYDGAATGGVGTGTPSLLGPDRCN